MSKCGFLFCLFSFSDTLAGERAACSAACRAAAAAAVVVSPSV